MITKKCLEVREDLADDEIREEELFQDDGFLAAAGYIAEYFDDEDF